jgi:hypothetical protein
VAIKLSTAARNALLDGLTTTAGGSAKLRIYDGSQPAGPGTAVSTQTLLAELTCNATFAPSASGGVLTLNSITADSSADATGTASWFRLLTSGSTAVLDGSVTATGGGGDMTLSSTSITSGASVAISSFTVTAGNA